MPKNGTSAGVRIPVVRKAKSPHCCGLFSLPAAVSAAAEAEAYARTTIAISAIVRAWGVVAVTVAVVRPIAAIAIVAVMAIAVVPIVPATRADVSRWLRHIGCSLCLDCIVRSLRCGTTEQRGRA